MTRAVLILVLLLATPHLVPRAAGWTAQPAVAWGTAVLWPRVWVRT